MLKNTSPSVYSGISFTFVIIVAAAGIRPSPALRDAELLTWVAANHSSVLIDHPSMTKLWILEGCSCPERLEDCKGRVIPPNTVITLGRQGAAALMNWIFI